MPKHIHIHFAPRRTRDQASGSVPGQAQTGRHPPAHVNALVHALFQAIKDRQGSVTMPTADQLRTDLTAFKFKDAGEWDESKHPRGEGGQFSSAEHSAAAENHKTAAMGHGHAAQTSGAGPMASMHTKASMHHTEAAEAHELAAKHIDAGTGLGEEFAKQAHSKTYQAAGHSQKLEGLAGGNMMGAAHAHLKKIASDPKQPVAKRAEATEQLAKLEKTANAVANSPHAKAQVLPGQDPRPNPLGSKEDFRAAVKAHGTSSGPSTGQRDPGAKFAGAMAANKGGSGSMESAKATGVGGTQIKPMPKQGTGFKPTITSPMGPGNPLEGVGSSTPELSSAQGGDQPAGAKPTQATAKAAKAATHELLSSGHPFSVDDLMKATGVTNKATIMTALSDLKNPKYAGALGALQIEKQPDGQYRVTKAPAGGFKAVGAPTASAAPGGAAPTGSTGRGPAPGEEGYDPHKVVHGSHPLSEYMPGQKVTAKGMKGTQYEVKGHNAEGHVVLQGPNGMHRMSPEDLKKSTVAGAKPAAAAEPPSTPSTVPEHEIDDREAFEGRNSSPSKTNEQLANEDASPRNYMDDLPKRADSGVNVKHQPSGTAVPHQAKPAKSIWGSPKPTLKPKDLAVRSGQNTDPKMAVKSGPKPGPDGKPMGVHPEMAAAAKAVAANPRTTGGSSKPLHVQRQEKKDAAAAAAPKPVPNLHNTLGSGGVLPPVSAHADAKGGLTLGGKKTPGKA